MSVVPKLQAPIVLVPGLLGFDHFKVGNWTLASYFPGIPEFLGAFGNRVLIARPSPTCGVAQRAAELKAFLDKNLPGEAVHLVAHIMGGLDARFMISCLAMAARVLSLTTIGTPHRGTAFADWGIHHLERLLAPIFDTLAIPRQAFYDLTTTRCRAFNEHVLDVPGVRYFSIAGHFEGGWLRPEWHLPHTIVKEAEGANDGIVSVASATYGEACDVWTGDHVSLISWQNPLAQAHSPWGDRPTNFAALVRRLADAAF